jgi:hypothetical protein
MNVFFPLKISGPIDYEGTFSNHIKRYFGGESAYYPVKATFEKIQKLRNELDFSKYNKLISTDYRVCDELEGKLIEYLSYALLLDKRFKFESFHPNYVELPVAWCDSFVDKSIIKINNFKLEIACSLYNLAVNEFHSGWSYSLNNTDEEKKRAVAKFRVGVWAIRELKQLLPLFQKDTKINHLDFSLTNLNCLENTMMGLGYLALFDIHSKNEKTLGIMNVTSIIAEASNHFKLAQNILFQDKTIQLPQNLNLKIRVLLFYYASYCEGITSLKLAKYHEELQEEKPLDGHMGYCLSYVSKGATVMKTAAQKEKDFEFLPSFLKERLLSQSKELNQKFLELKQKNEVVYKHRTFGPDELPGAQEIHPKLKLSGVPPSLLQQAHPDEKYFENFISEEIKQELKEFK